MIKHLILILTLTTASLPLHAQLTEPNTYKSQVDRLNHYAHQARDHKTFDDATQTLNFIATGTVPNSGQSVPIRTTGPTDEEWVNIIRAMYNLTQTTFNPYTLLEGLNKNSSDYGHRLGTFLAYQLTKLHSIGMINTIKKAYQSDYKSLLPYLIPYSTNNGTDPSLQHDATEWLIKFLKYQGQLFTNVYNKAVQQERQSSPKKLEDILPLDEDDREYKKQQWEAYRLWEYTFLSDVNHHARDLILNGKHNIIQSVFEMKAYMDGDNSVTNNVEKSINSFENPYILDFIKSAYDDAKKQYLSKRHLEYKTYDIFDKTGGKSYQNDRILYNRRLNLYKNYPSHKQLLDSLFGIIEKDDDSNVDIVLRNAIESIQNTSDENAKAQKLKALLSHLQVYCSRFEQLSSTVPMRAYNIYQKLSKAEKRLDDDILSKLKTQSPTS